MSNMPYPSGHNPASPIFPTSLAYWHLNKTLPSDDLTVQPDLFACLVSLWQRSSTSELSEPLVSPPGLHRTPCRPNGRRE